MSGLLPRRGVLAVMGAALVEGACLAQQAPEANAYTPEQFGARGDGLTNDTAAFRGLAAAVNRRGGGTIVLRPVTYLVGEQTPAPASSGFAYRPSPILELDNLTTPLIIRGNGAILRCAPGLRYGSFIPGTGLPHRHAMPFSELSTRATPYHFMILIQRCRAAVEVTDLELDGNARRLKVGGPYGDVGIQIAGTGLFLRDNEGPETLRRIHTHHHPQDGLMIDGLSDARAPMPVRIAERVRCNDNGRQGCSLVGGRNWVFSACTFNRTGRNGIASPPGAGLDIEAEGVKVNRDHRFIDCQFVDNSGAGMVADTGDSASATFTRCKFVGTTSPSLWPNKPYFRFDDCRIVGTMVRCFGSADVRSATQFRRCLFTDASAQSPTAKVYRQGRADGPLADLSDAANVLFDACTFLASDGAVLPWSTGAIYKNCTMKQASRSPAYPRGLFTGRNIIDAPVDIGASTIRGLLVINGRAITR